VPAWGLLILVVVANAAIFWLLARFLFAKNEFLEAFRYFLEPDIAFLRGDWVNERWVTKKGVVWLLICIVVLCFEYRVAHQQGWIW